MSVAMTEGKDHQRNENRHAFVEIFPFAVIATNKSCRVTMQIEVCLLVWRLESKGFLQPYFLFEF